MNNVVVKAPYTIKEVYSLIEQYPSIKTSGETVVLGFLHNWGLVSDAELKLSYMKSGLKVC